MSKGLIHCPLCSHCTLDNLAALVSCLINFNTKNIQCPECDELITGLDNLISHLLIHINKKKSEITWNETSSAKNSTDTSTRKTTECAPRNGTIIHNNDGNSMWCCEVCGIYFADEGILRLHQKLHSDHSGEKQNCYPCHICTKAFQMRGTLMVHLRVAHYGSHHGNPLARLKMQNLAISEIAMSCDSHTLPSESGSEQQDNKQWPCDVCQKSFTTKYFLKKHKRLHTGETPYCCKLCNKSFTFQQSYHKHILYHNDDKPYACTECGRAFKELSTLHNHQRIHTGERPFACETCGKCFRQRVSYLVHRRIHTGVLPYKCTACNKSFRYKVSQRTHKCTSQPPGIVVRQPVNLLEKIMKNIQDNRDDNTVQTDNNTNEEIVRRSAKLSLEETESENFSILELEHDNRSVTAHQTDHLNKHILEDFPQDLFELNNLESVLNNF